jgi:nucleoside-diphosphate-sugar epimerase
MYDKPTTIKKVCIVGASGKLGQYMVQHALGKGYEVVGVCRERSVGKLEKFKGRITVIPGFTNDPQVTETKPIGTPSLSCLQQLVFCG